MAEADDLFAWLGDADQQARHKINSLYAHARALIGLPAARDQPDASTPPNPHPPQPPSSQQHNP